MSVGGNLWGFVQIRTENGHMNKIREWEAAWQDCLQLWGWLDLSTGDANRIAFSAKIQESSHIFLCDYQPLVGITSENARMVIEGRVYDILLIDDPMYMHEHYEIYLKFIGGQNG